MDGMAVVPEATVPRRTSAAIAVALAVALGGCAADSFTSLELNPFKGGIDRSADYNYFYKRESRSVGTVSAADLVGPDGRCAFEAAPSGPYPTSVPAAPSTAAPEPIDPRSNRALYFTAGPQAGTQQTGIPSNAAVPPEVRGGPRGVALAMTECEVVRLAGTTDRVEISADARGRRSVVMTYMTGERPGIYHFTDGRLVSMERVEGLPAPKKQPARKTKTAKSKQGT
jgi:hypothetical protein